MIDAFKRASAWRITAVLPYYCYARQDRKDKPRVPISAKLVADLLETAGASRALTLDLHAPQIQGYFDVPVDHLYGSPVLVEHFRHMKLPNLTVVSPDAGGVERARFFAKRLDAPLAIVDKRRVDVDDGQGGIQPFGKKARRSEEHTSELQSPCNLVCRLLLEKKKQRNNANKSAYFAVSTTGYRLCRVSSRPSTYQPVL